MSPERIVASAHAVFSTAIARVRARAQQTRVCGHDVLWQAWFKVASAAAGTACATLAHAADNAKHVTSATSDCAQALPFALHPLLLDVVPMHRAFLGELRRSQ